jgi:hypothetical protein
LLSGIPKKDNGLTYSVAFSREGQIKTKRPTFFWQQHPNGDSGACCERPDLRENRRNPRRFNIRPEDSMQPQRAAVDSPDEPADDILEGAEAIAEFLFRSKDKRRKVYNLAETSRLPIFRLGSTLCARKSVLLQFIADQENRVLRKYASRIAGRPFGCPPDSENPGPP